MEKGDEAQEWQGENGGGNRNGEKEYKKGIIIYLFTRATPGTPVSNVTKKPLISKPCAE